MTKHKQEKMFNLIFYSTIWARFKSAKANPPQRCLLSVPSSVILGTSCSSAGLCFECATFVAKKETIHTLIPWANKYTIFINLLLLRIWTYKASPEQWFTPTRTSGEWQISWQVPFSLSQWIVSFLWGRLFLASFSATKNTDKHLHIFI